MEDWNDFFADEYSVANGCAIEAESPLKILCVGFAADLKRKARTEDEIYSER